MSKPETNPNSTMRAGWVLAGLLATLPARASFPGAPGPLVYQRLPPPVLGLGHTPVLSVWKHPSMNGSEQGPEQELFKIPLRSGQVGLQGHPALAPNGAFIAVACEPPGGQIQEFPRPELFLWRAPRPVHPGMGQSQPSQGAGGLDPTPLTNTAIGPNRAAAALPAWSPRGTQIAYLAYHPGGLERLTQLRILDLRGAQTLCTDAGPFRPAWSPDGRCIAFTRHNQLWIYRRESNKAEALTQPTEDPSHLPYGAPHPYPWHTSPAWSPDGTRLALVRTDGDGGRRHLCIMNADGSSAPTPLESGAYHDWDPEWTADGKSLIYTSDRTGVAEIYVRDLDPAHGDLAARDRRVTHGDGPSEAASSCAFQGIPFASSGASHKRGREVAGDPPDAAASSAASSASSSSSSSSSPSAPAPSDPMQLVPPHDAKP
jgi:hypothetical protein